MTAGEAGDAASSAAMHAAGRTGMEDSSGVERRGRIPLPKAGRGGFLEKHEGAGEREMRKDFPAQHSLTRFQPSLAGSHACSHVPVRLKAA